MKREEAIYELQEDKRLYETEVCHAGDGSPDGRLLEALDMAIEALSEGDVAREISTILENEQDMRVILHNADRPTRGREDATEEDYAYCDDCEAVEMCMWYPYDGCQFKVSRPMGEWIPCTKGGLPLTELSRREGQKWYGYKCSECNFIYKGNALTESPFCQNCGVDMRSEKEYLDKTFPEHEGGEWFDITDMMTKEIE